jgi:hypothetical protein
MINLQNTPLFAGQNTPLFAGQNTPLFAGQNAPLFAGQNTPLFAGQIKKKFLFNFYHLAMVMYSVVAHSENLVENVMCSGHPCSLPLNSLGNHTKEYNEYSSSLCIQTCHDS